MKPVLESRAARMRLQNDLNFRRREMAKLQRRGPNGWRFTGPAGISTKAVLEAVAVFYGIPQTIITARDNTPECVEPRHVAMYLAKELSARSVSAIARSFNRHHSTVLYAIKRLKEVISVEPMIAAKVAVIRRRLVDVDDLKNPPTRFRPEHAFGRIRQLRKLAASMIDECDAIEKELLLLSGDGPAS